MQTLKVIKIGGNIIDDDTALRAFLSDFAKLDGPKILVHGGGKLATRMADKMEVPVKMLEGRRITDAETLDIITMVYAGKINKNMVAQLQGFGCNAIGFTGADGNMILSSKRPIKTIDYGYVGDVKSVNGDLLSILLNTYITPVFCAITHDGKGQLLNTNADTIASEIAIACANMFKTELYYCFEKNGVLQDVTNEASVIGQIDSTSYRELISKRIIADGMLPKMTNCFHAVNNQVHKVCLGKTEMLFEENANYTTIKK